MIDRLSESLDVMRKLRQFHIPHTDTGLKELGQHMTAFIKHGTVWSGNIYIPYLDRNLHVVFPNNPNMPMRVVLKG